MKKLQAITITAVLILGMFGTTMMMGLLDSYATKIIKESQNTTILPERQFQQPSEAPGTITTQPERQQSQQPSEASEDNTDPQRQTQFGSEPLNSADQQEDENSVIEQKDEQIRDVLQEEEDDDENNGGNEEQTEDDDGIREQVEIDKKAPIAISGEYVYIVWFNDQNTPDNNSEVLFRSSTSGGITFADKINLSNTTSADSINAEIAADGNNVIITWWERNATSIEPVVRISTDNGETFGSLLRLATNGTIGAAAE